MGICFKYLHFKKQDCRADESSVEEDQSEIFCKKVGGLSGECHNQTSSDDSDCGDDLWPQKRVMLISGLLDIRGAGRYCCTPRVVSIANPCINVMYVHNRGFQKTILHTIVISKLW